MLQFASERIEQARLHCAEQIEQAARFVVDELMAKCNKQIELVKTEYTDQIEHVELTAIRELLQGGTILKIFSGAVPDDCSDPDPGVCLASISLPETPFKRDGDRLVIAEPPFVGWGTPEAGRGRLARSLRFCRDGECVGQGSVSEPEGNGVLRLQRPAIKTGQKIVVAEFNFVMRND
jgi:hypothetical protein